MSEINLEDGLRRFSEIIRGSDNVVFFGGAGVSTESGIPDFRSADGIYRQSCKYSPEEILSRDFFTSHPEEFFEFYRKSLCFPSVKPNAAHYKLAELEKVGKLKAVITQNIDGLHSKAGSKNVLELHGSLLRNYCMRCGRFYDFNFVYSSKKIPKCECGGIIKPDVVLYGEQLDADVTARAVKAISDADVLIVAGTSLSVYPAAGFIGYFRGRSLIFINRDPTRRDGEFSLVIRAKVGEVLSSLDLSRF